MNESVPGDSFSTLERDLQNTRIRISTRRKRLFRAELLNAAIIVISAVCSVLWVVLQLNRDGTVRTVVIPPIALLGVFAVIFVFTDF